MVFGKALRLLLPSPFHLFTVNWGEFRATDLAIVVLGNQKAAMTVYQNLMTLDTVVSAKGDRAKAGTVQAAAGTPTTDLRDGWMASPLIGQAFHPEALDRCPRAVLQVRRDV